MATTYSLNIVTATWGQLDVTNKVRSLYAMNASPTRNSWTIEPTDSWIGADPIVGNQKVFVCTWRVLLLSGLNSALQATVVKEGERGTINYDGANLSPFNPPQLGDNAYIVNAYWWNKDVTKIVQDIAGLVTSSKQIKVPASKAVLGADPAFGTLKSLVITYGYKLESGDYQFGLSTSIDGSNAVFNQGPAPPRLLIKTASYGGVDWTSEILKVVDPMSQSIKVTNYTTLGWSDPWPNVPKALVVMYQWENRELELLISNDITPTITIDPLAPVDPLRKAFFNPAGRLAGETNILAVTWGIMSNRTDPVSDLVFKSIKDLESFVATNEYYGFDGWPWVLKTATVFYQYGITGEIHCISARGASSGVPTPLDPRSPVFNDPLPGRGFLRNIGNLFKGFQIQIKETGRYFGIFPNKDQLYLATFADESNAALFQFAPLGGSSGSNFTVLSCQDPKDPNSPFYASLTAGDNQVILTKDRKAAIETHYELPGTTASACLVISFRTDPATKDPLVFRAAPLEIGAVVGKVEAIPIFIHDIAKNDQAQFAEYLLIANWLSVAENQIPVGRSGTLDPILRSTIHLFVDFFWELPGIFFGWTSGSFTREHLADIALFWFDELTEDQRSPILQTLDSFKSVEANRLGSAQLKNKLGSPNLGTMWKYFVILIKAVYESGSLWTFYKCIFKTMGLLDWAIFVAGFLKFLLENVFPTAGWYLTVAKGIYWAIQTADDLLSLLAAKASPLKLPGNIQEALFKLNLAIQKVTPIVLGSNFSDESQLELVRALYQPHWSRLLRDHVARPPKKHLSSELRKLREVPLLTEDESVNDYLRQTLALEPAARDLYDLLEPLVERALLEEPTVRFHLLDAPTVEKALSDEPIGTVQESEELAEPNGSVQEPEKLDEPTGTVQEPEKLAEPNGTVQEEPEKLGEPTSTVQEPEKVAKPTGTIQEPEKVELLHQNKAETVQSNKEYQL